MLDPEGEEGADFRDAAPVGGRIVIEEDHHPECRIGSADLEALAGTDTPELHAVLLSVKAPPASGKPQELLADARRLLPP